jgi:hypothetical protein
LLEWTRKEREMGRDAREGEHELVEDGEVRLDLVLERDERVVQARERRYSVELVHMLPSSTQA